METGPGGTSVNAASSRAWYGEVIADFLERSSDFILGRLTANADFAVVPEQRDAWLVQIEFLRTELSGLSGAIFLEFNIPRMGRRIDAVLLIGGIVLVVEFKVGDNAFDGSAL